MKTSKNTNKTVVNQYITSSLPSRIESPLILSALLIGLLILTACGSAAVAPTEDITRLEGELRVAKRAQTTAETAQTTAETAQETAERLQAEAERLQGLAETARDTAITARDEAVTATSVANTERGNAITARDNALKAQMDAETAQGLAEQAQMDAETAQGLAETAQANAETDKATAERLQMEAETAQGIAETARMSAETARMNAETARDNALKAQMDAETAQGLAEQAQGIAETAQASAETAQGLAETAQMEAETARDTAIGERDTARGERDTLQTSLNTANTNLSTTNTNLNAEKAETTRLTQFIRPTYATWEIFVNPETVPNTAPSATPQNQFLQTTTDQISSTGTNAQPQAIQRLNLATTTFDGLALGGETADGVAFFRGAIGGINYNYAGVFEGTDLGMPLTDTTGSAIWNGSFGHVLGDVLNPSKDFTLHIAFDANGGTLDAFVLAGVANNNFIFDNVRFDTRGFITGEVLYVTPLNDSATQTATLRGVIGEQGAVGAFVGEVGADIGGAFVAHPTAALDPNTINFADWAGAAGNPKTTVMNKDNTGTEPLVNGVANVTSGSFANFVQGLEIVDDFGFNFAGTPHATATDVDGTFLLLEADSPSGVAYSSVHESGGGALTHYVGLLPGTTLGAPLPDSFPTTIWDAKLGAIRRSADQIHLYSNPSFKMRVIFNGSTGTINSGTLSNQSFTPGTISVPFTVNGTSYVSNKQDFNIEGKFGSDGLLYGKVTNFNRSSVLEATLTGLIGVNGAVGAFVFGNFGGGFVAKPPE